MACLRPEGRAVNANERAYFDRHGWPERLELFPESLSILDAVDRQAAIRRKHRLYRVRRRVGAELISRSDSVDIGRAG